MWLKSLTRLILVLVFAASANSCGGGGGSGGNSDSTQAPPIQGHYIDYGYYLTSGSQPSEVYGSTTIAFLGGPVTSEAELLNQAATYSNLGIRKFIVNLIGIDPARAGDLLGRIAAFGTVFAVYPVDEPNINGCNPAVLQQITSLGYPLFTIYAPTKYGTVCTSYFDIIGLDDYEVSPQQAFGELETLGRLNPSAKLAVVPGGASPWKADPQPFFDYAKSNPRVILIIPFLWATLPQAPVGIRDNGMSQTYQNLGKEIIQYNGSLGTG